MVISEVSSSHDSSVGVSVQLTSVVLYEDSRAAVALKVDVVVSASTTSAVMVETSVNFKSWKYSQACHYDDS